MLLAVSLVGCFDIALICISKYLIHLIIFWRTAAFGGNVVYFFSVNTYHRYVLMMVFIPSRGGRILFCEDVMSPGKNDCGDTMFTPYRGVWPTWCKVLDHDI